MDVLLQQPPLTIIPHSLPPIKMSSPPIQLVTTALTLLVPVLAALYIQHDYRAFLSLGPGGTPATPLGYLKIKVLSIIALRDPCRPLPVPPHFRPHTGYLASLPFREGKRPLVQGIAPQRQQTQKSDAAVYKKLVEKLRGLAREPSNKLLERTSCFEKHSSGLFSSTPITRTCGGEICHAHPSDGSLHMTLHPADAKMVIECGWGERHPLARGGWCRRFVPREFMLVYAPRNEEEVDTVVKIVAAGVWWVSGIDINREVSKKKKNREVNEVMLREAKERTECWACKMHGCGNKSKEKMVGDA